MILEAKRKIVPNDFEKVHKVYQEFEWDINKSNRAVLSHEISFSTAALIFKNDRIERPDYGEGHFDERDEGKRIYTIGKIVGLKNEVLYCTVIFIEISDSKARIISARLSEKDERRCYLEYC